MSALPDRLATTLDRVYRRLFPGPLGAEVRADLAEGRAHVRSRRGAWTAALWYAAHLVAPSTWRLAVALRREPERRLRRARRLEMLARDARYAARTLRRSPGFAAASIVTLGIGVGAATAIFSVVDAVLLRPLPYGDPERIVQLWEINEGFGRARFSEQNFQDVRERARSFESLAAYDVSTSAVSLREAALRVPMASVSEGFFEALGVEPALGRTFPRGEVRAAAPVAVVSDDLWRDELGAAELGSVFLRIGPRAYTVIGVLPPGSAYPRGTRIWTPREPDPRAERTGHNWRVIGRLATGVGIDAAREEVRRLAADLKREHGDETDMIDVEPVPLRDQLVGQARAPLLVLMGAALFLLLVACANVLGLQLARGTSRGAEIAVRRSLGAGRGRLSAQLVTESLVLGAAGGALGLALAAAGVDGLLALEPGRLPRVEDVELNGVVLAFGLGVSTLAAAALGAVVATRVTGDDLRNVLAEASRPGAGGRRTARARSALIGLQVATTLVLLAGAGLLGRSFLALSAVDPGYRTSGAVVVDAYLPPEMDDRLAEVGRTRDVLLERLQAIPGRGEVGIVSAFPMSGRGSDGGFLIMDRPDQATDLDGFRRLAEEPDRSGYAEYRAASSGYFGAMRIPLLRGRLFDERDAPGAAVHAAVISESLAERWPGADPIGKFVQYANMDFDVTPYEIVGVVGDVREAGQHAEALPTFYGNALQRTATLSSGFTLVVGAEADAGPSAAAVSTAVRESAPDVPLQVRTLEEIFSASVAARRFNLVLLAAFALAAAVLAVTGIYGVVSYLVARHTHEWAVRIALGAGRAQVIGHVVTGGLTSVLGGIAVGIAVALWAGRLLEGLLFGVTATDPLTLGGVAAGLAAVALLASLLPAVRATRVDPVAAMRE